MARNIGNLPLIGSRLISNVGRIAKVACALEGVGKRRIKIHVARQAEIGLCRDIGSPNAHLPQIHHHPAILSVALRHGYYLVGYVVVVAIGTEIEAVKQCPLVAAGIGVLESQIILIDHLGAQRGVAHIGIIQVVEGGHTESSLDE